ncbi:RcnB family protein [Paraburkholderia rhizosphaerae]|uniref:Nickel/cobalt transporter regulator n=1 Tax=Paraburkholderia rhizosphaerae TaxID=480658 RepID=A0A4R8L6C3_9BURK|nr:RcnB family protein [Paraburkholderia rhizosphaerae]TDY38206.1 nickel/cobalt transporter regulator [Paraburkholderia rhizosphaerae]
MKSQFVLSIIAALLVGVAPAAFAQTGPAGDQGFPRQQVMPSIPSKDWKTGQLVPAYYRDRIYVIDRPQDHSLSAAGRGQKWLGINGDYVLANQNWKISKIVPGVK